MKNILVIMLAMFLVITILLQIKDANYISEDVKRCVRSTSFDKNECKKQIEEKKEDN